VATVSGESRAASVAKVLAVVAGLVIFAAAAAGVWRLVDERDQANCIAAAEAGNPVVVVPDNEKFRRNFFDDPIPAPSGYVEGESERRAAVRECG
jgi:hypothetical protein